ncbi:MAG: glycosyltransferase family 2 protein [Acidimicrobiales bacterium]
MTKPRTSATAGGMGPASMGPASMGPASMGPASMGPASKDPRLGPTVWPSAKAWFGTRRRLRMLVVADVVASLWYFDWLLRPSRIGDPYLYWLLVAAEMFNLVQAAGFWWTSLAQRSRPRPTRAPKGRVDVLVPVYDEPLDVVGPTVAAAARLHGATVHLLDDKGRPELERLAEANGARYLKRPGNEGAKAGNLNHALRHTTAPFVAVFDCDHVPDRRFLAATLPHLSDPRVAFVQTPQYYANANSSPIAKASWSQQALFFGGIANGKDGLGAMFCCGTNVVFRREALQEVGGFPESSVTEDFQLSIKLHEAGFTSAYLPEVLAKGLGPEDMASYIGQQLRWARGCLSSFPLILRSRLGWRASLQYLLSASFFLTGWTLLAYMSLPVVRILTGAQPLAQATAAQFLVHFAPYFALSLFTVATAGAGSYAFGAYSLLVATFWVHIAASLASLSGRKGRFVVTAKAGAGRRQPLAVLPTLVAIAVLAGSAVYGLVLSRAPAIMNNVAFAAFHISVLLAGAWPALARDGGIVAQPAAEVTAETAA